jgi:hypothetical protein
MTLFSWFIKSNKQATYGESNKRGDIATSDTGELKNGLTDEVGICNNNMWPIAKVETTSMIIKKPIIKAAIALDIPKKRNTSLVTIPFNC